MNKTVALPPPIHAIADSTKTPLPKSESFDPVLHAAILATGLVGGITYNLLVIGAAGIGANLFLTTAVFFAGWFFLARRKPIPAWRKVCAAAALIYSAALAFRAADILFTLNISLMIAFVILACSPSFTSRISSVAGLVLNGLQVGFCAIFGSIFFALETPWDKLRPNNTTSRVAARVAIGVLISFPFLLIFGSLFAHAELRFGSFFDALFSALSRFIFQNFWGTMLAAAFAVGLLYASFLSKPFATIDPTRRKFRIGFVESITVLALLTAMFAIFVATQLPYFFGGQSRVSSVPHLAWSDYARRGFFELSTVAALLIPTLMLFQGCAAIDTSGQRRTINLLSAALSVLTGIIIISAFQRMLLYARNYGLTELRIYVSTFIVAIAIAIFLLNYYAIKARPYHFIPAVFILGFIFSIGIQIPNVQALVARDTIQRNLAGQQSDMQYLTTLSTDALPAIMASSLSTEKKRELKLRLLANTNGKTLGRKPLEGTLSAQPWEKEPF